MADDKNTQKENDKVNVDRVLDRECFEQARELSRSISRELLTSSSTRSEIAKYNQIENNFLGQLVYDDYKKCVEDKQPQSKSR